MFCTPLSFQLLHHGHRNMLGRRRSCCNASSRALSFLSLIKDWLSLSKNSSIRNSRRLTTLAHEPSVFRVSFFPDFRNLFQWTGEPSFHLPLRLRLHRYRVPVFLSGFLFRLSLYLRAAHMCVHAIQDESRRSMSTCIMNTKIGAVRCVSCKYKFDGKETHVHEYVL